MQLITTKPTIYLVNLTMKDYLRQKSKYLPLIAKWVTEHGGLPRDIIPFSVEFEEKSYSLREDPEKLADFLKESKVKSRLEKIITEGFTKLGLYYYFTGKIAWLKRSEDKNLHMGNQRARRRSDAGRFRKVASHRKLVRFHLHRWLSESLQEYT